MSTSGLQVERGLSTTDTIFGFPTCHPFAISNLPTAFILAFLLAEGKEWLISQQFGCPSLTPWDWPQDCGF